MKTLPASKALAVTKGKNPTGRPTKYKEEYCQAILDWFDIEPYFERVVEEKKELYANGNERSVMKKTQLTPNRLPTLYRFAKSIGVNQDTLHEWASKHETFSEALKSAKEMQKEFLIDAGMAGASNPAVTIFTAKNVSDMRDKIERSDTVTHQVFFVPRAIAEKHGLQLPEGEQEKPRHIPSSEITMLPTADPAADPV